LGYDANGGVVTVFPNGNFLVRIPYWDNGALAEAGAVVFGGGSAGPSGPVAGANAVTGQAASTNLLAAVVDSANGAFYSRFLNEGGGRVRVGSQTTGFIAGTLTAVSAAGTLTVTDVAARDNQITVSRSGGNLVIADAAQPFASAPAGGSLSNGNKTLTIPLASVSALQFNLAGGNDRLTVDYSTGYFDLPIGYDGGAGGTDALAVKGDRGTFDTTSATYGPDPTSTAANKKGAVRVTSGASTSYLTFSNLEPVDVSGMAVASLASLGAPATPLAADNDLTVAAGVANSTPGQAALVVTGTTNGGATPIEQVAFFNNTQVLIDTSGVAGSKDVVTVTGGTNAHGNVNVAINTGAENGDAIRLNGALAASGAVNLTTGGPITDGNGTLTPDVKAASVMFLAGTGIGTAIDLLEVDADTFTSVQTTSGGVNVDVWDSNNSTNTIGTVSAGSGNVVFFSTSGGGAASVNVFTGVLASNGTIDLSRNTDGALRVQALTASGTARVSAFGSTVSAIDHPSGAIVAGGPIDLVADTMTLSGGTINAGANPVEFAPAANNRNVQIGAGAPTGGGVLGLSDVSLGTVTSNQLVIGGFSLGGTIAVVGAVPLAGKTLYLGSSANAATPISDGTAGAGGAVVTAGSLGVFAASGGVDLSFNADTVAVNSSGPQYLQETDTVTVGSVSIGLPSVSGLSASSNTITLGGGTFALGASNQITDSTAVNVSGGALAVGTFSDTVAQLTLTSGSVTGTTGVLTSTAIIQVMSGSASARLGGTNGLAKTTGGTVSLTSATSPYTGTTTISNGVLSVTKVAAGGVPSSLGATAAATPIQISGGAVLEYAGTGDSTNRQITLGGVGTVRSTTGPLTLTGAVNNGGNLLTLDATGGSIAVNSQVSGGGGLTKTGGGTASLGVANTYTGPTNITNGTLLVDGSITSATTVTSPGVLGGGGTITGTVTGTGTVEPGTNGVGTLTVVGNFTPTGTVRFEVNAPYTTAGTDYDRLVVNGAANAVNLGGATVVFQSAGGGTPPAIPAGITLIQNNTSNPTTPFSNPAEGGIVTLGAGGNARPFKISYAATDGNDTVLFDASPPTTVYVSTTFTGPVGQVLADADFGTTGNQAAMVGYNAFATIAAALGVAAVGGTVVVNAGSYGETISLTGATATALRVTGPDAPQAVTITALSTSVGTTVTLQGASSLTVGDGNPQTIAGLVAGTGRLVKQGGGTLAVAGTNTYAGGTTLAGGALDVRTDTALGTGTLTINGGTTILSGSGARTLALPVVVAGSFTAGGTNSLHLGSGTASPVDLNGGSPTVTVTNGTMDLFLDGRVQNGALGATGAGRLALTQANVFAGGLTVGTATVTFDTNTAAGTGTLTINGGTVAATGGTRTLANPVTVGGNFAVGSATFGQSLVLDGNVDLGGAVRAVTVAAASPATFAGPLSNGGLGKAGTGTLILTGASTYAGATAVTDGTLQLDGSVTSSVTVTTPGVLIGTGTVAGNVDGTGTFSPGTAAGPGTMTVTGNFTPSGTVNFEVNAPFTTPGGTSDQYAVGGAVSLTGATVTFANSTAGTPAAGQVVRLVNRTSAGANAPAATPADGSFLTTAGLTTFRVFYNGGDGNDVTLVDSSAAPATVYVNDDWAALTSGTQLADADPAAAGNQPAILGVSAFADVQPALDALAAGGGTVVVWGSGAVGVSANYAAFTVGKPAAFRLVADPNGESTVTVGGTISLNGQDLGGSLDQGAGTVNLVTAAVTGTAGTPAVSVTTTAANTGNVTLGGAVSGVGGVTLGATGSRLNGVTLGGVSTGSGGVSVFANGPITLNGSVSTTAAAAAGPVAITGNVLLSGPVAISTDSTTDASITVTGTVNNAQPLTLAAGTGAVSLGGAVGGTTPLTSFTVTSAGAAALPAVTTTGNVGVTAGAITLSGDLRTDAGANAGAVTLTGPVTLAASVGIDTDAAGTDGDVSFSTSVSGTGRGLTVTAGGGDVAFGGNVSTSAARLADLTVACARNVTAAGIAASNTVRQLAGSGTTTLVGLLDVQPGGGPATGAVALTGTNFAITGGVTAWSVVVTHTGANSLNVSGGDVTTLTAGATGVYGFTAVAVTAGTTGSVASRVTGPGNVTKQGPGTLTLSSGTNSYTGTTTVDGGTLLVTGLVPGAAAVNTTGTLGGTGTVSGTVTVNNGGHVAPGVATGVLQTGPVTFAGGSSFDVQVNGTTPGTQADQLAVTGTLNLGGATLNVSGTIPSVVGQVVKIVDNDGTADPVVGTFAGIPEGGTVLINGSNFAVSYVGGDGNDVTLTQLAFVGYVETGGGADFVLRRNQNGTPANPADDLLQLLRNGVLVDSRPLSALSSYTLIGQNGATDTLTVDYAFGGVFTTPIEFAGGTAAADRMTLSGATFTTAALAYSNATDGTVTLDGATVTYTGLEALVSTLTV
ncbi:MAG: autotransporter-associated beta strand repeat-containing protein, partial [Gemmataceae bacterium]|nr:autotransporter-associated beta strand repeat-containing protein [Gemmataceae bacterium]